LLEDVVDASIVPSRILFRYLGMIVREVLPSLGLGYQAISAEQLVFLFGNRLGLPEELKIKAINLLEKTSKTSVSLIGKDPKGLAAAVLYLVAKNTEFKKTQFEVAKASKVTEVTIRSRIKDFKDLLDNSTKRL
ncbi:MAG: hypothetical protein ACFFB0_08145, partial [Promethearchaeota archaeon]